MPLPPDQLGRLKDILESAQRIAEYVSNTTEAQFVENREKQDAVIRRIEIIGEATARLTDETRLELPSLPFRRMRGMRNIVAHNYANVDLKIVWDVATIHVPELRTALEEFFRTQISASPEGKDAER